MNSTLMRIFPIPPSFNGFCFHQEMEMVKLWITIIIMQARRIGFYEFAEVFVRYILVPMFFAFIFNRKPDELDVRVYVNGEEAVQQEPLIAEILEQLSSHPEGMTAKALLRALHENWPELTRHSLRARLTILYDEGTVYNFIGRADSLLWATN